MNEMRRVNIWMIVSGVIMIIFGIICVWQRGLTITILAMIAGAGFTVSGIFDIIAYISGRKLEGYSGWMLFEAVVDLVVGLMLLLHPFAFSAVIPWVIAGFIVAAGIILIVSSLRSRSIGTSWVPLLLSGIVTVIFGIVLFVRPDFLAVLIGIYALVRGIALTIGGIAFNKALCG